MARVVLITGGSRSGKSRMAQQQVEAYAGERVYLATCPRVDKEMESRIMRHQRERAGRGWLTVEEPVDLAEAVAAVSGTALLVDCLTLWVNNLLFTAGESTTEFTEDAVAARCRELVESCRRREGLVVVVTNEVGLGVVPDNPLGRRYRDLVGRANQVVAAAADQVILMVSGLPLTIKG